MIPLAMLKWWKLGLGALMGALLMYGAMQVKVWLLNASHALEIQNVKASIIKVCESDKQITKEVSSEFQSKIFSLNNRIADLKRVQLNVCVPIANPTTGRNAITGAGHASRNAINTTALYDYAGTAEKYRIQLIACQNFINKTWEAKKDPRG